MAETMQVDEVNEDKDMKSSGEESGDDDSLSSDDDEKEEIEMKNKCEALLSQIKENPYMYNSHVELIKNLKSLGDLEQLRKAREYMSELFPLSEDLWLDWLKDESGIATEKADREKVYKLFEKATQDYLSVPIWLEYVQFAIGGMGQDGIQHVRDVFDKAITACGLHVTKGANLWEAYREFESAILSGLLPEPGKEPTKEQENKFSEQHDRVSNLFKRQLSVPLFDMKDTLKEYTDWLQEKPDNYCMQSYKKAVTKLDKIKPYEQNILSAEAPRLQEYQDYIQFEEKNGDPARIQCLYERAVQENCLNPALWLQYTKYLDHTLKVTSVTLPVFERSVRNCPWCVQLWQNYLLCLERANQSYDKIKEVFQTALTSGFSLGTEYLSLWITFLDYLRRKINWSEDHAEELDTFRLSMEKAVEQIDFYGAEGDPNGTLRQFWAVIEAKYCKNMEKARELWAEVMAAGRANEAALWMEFYRFERAYGDNKHCRRVLQRALNSVTDWPESIVDAYINFEREEGNLEQYEQAVSKCEAQMSRITERREKQAESEAATKEKKKLDKGKGYKQFDNKQKQPYQKLQPNQKQQFQKQQNQKQQFQKSAKHKQNEESFQEVKVYKRKHVQEQTSTSDNEFKVPEMPPAKMSRSTPPPGYKSPDSKSEPPPGFKGPNRSDPPPGYKDETKSSPPPGFKPPQEKVSSGPPPGFLGNKEAGADGDTQEGSDTKQSKGEDITPKVNDNDFRTAFISNLSYNVDEDQLRKFFVKCGQIDEIRLVKNFKGKSKGYAYIQFADQFGVVKALTYDRTPIDNRPMYVSKYEDRSQKNKADFREPTSKAVGRYRLYSPTDLTNAYIAVLERNIPVKTAAREFNVPHNTLRDRVKGRVNPETQTSGPSTIFTLEEEVKLNAHISYMASLGYQYTTKEFATNLEKNKLFIKNLPFTCTKEALTTLFAQHGELKDVRLVTYRSGQPKGLAYVDFVEEQAASQAIMKTDGLQMGEHTISVSLSNPPSRKDPSWKKEETSFMPSLGGGKKETQNRGVARTQVMLMPRSVKQKAQTKPGAGLTTKSSASDTNTESGDKPQNSAPESSAKSMSNSDFRNLLLKK